MSTSITTQKTVLLLGSGELGKEIAIELMRLGAHVIAADSYTNAPAAQIAHEAKVLPMNHPAKLRSLIDQTTPDIIIPEIEAIATNVLLDVESEGHISIVPTAHTAHLTMNRRGIRELAAEQLNLPTSDYHFASSPLELKSALTKLGLPAVVKPIQSSSGKGQSIINTTDAIPNAWQNAQTNTRGHANQVIVEKFIPFTYEITLLTVTAANGLFFLPPIGHRQINGDYIESWQPQRMKIDTLVRTQQIATKVVNALTSTKTGASQGYGIFGVEFFIIEQNDAPDTILFSEVSPRPHDTGMVTMISQNLSQFAIHAYAVLGLPIPPISLIAPAAASHALIAHGHGRPTPHIATEDLPPVYQIKIFGKPTVNGERRCGVALSTDTTIESAKENAAEIAANIHFSFE
jgi:phosphoribosylglycinamide formyltransferase 2